MWLNNLCNSEYPAVESLRDGTSYCTVVEAAVNRVAQNCTALQTSDAAMAQRRSAEAAQLAAKLDWTCTAFVTENVDPSLDSMAVLATCHHNMLILQDMLRQCVPPEFSLRIDVDRLASGKLQDHVKLLQWLFNFMTKLLHNYSRDTLGAKAAAAASVEGVRLNRAAKLLERKRSQQGASGRVSKASAPSPRSVSAEATPRRQQRPTSSTAAAPVRSASQGAPSLPSGSPRPKSGRPAARLGSVPRPAPEAEVLLSHYTAGTFVAPESQKEQLTLLRRQVEGAEALAMCEYERHQYNLTRSGEAVSSFVPSPSTVTVLNRNSDLMELALNHPPRPILSLAELGKLLEERDRLLQQFVTIEGAVGDFRQQGEADEIPNSALCSSIERTLRAYMNR